MLVITTIKVITIIIIIMKNTDILAEKNCKYEVRTFLEGESDMLFTFEL